MQRPSARWLSLAAQFLVIAVVFAFIGQTIRRLAPEMARVAWRPDPALLAAAVALGFSTQLLLGAGWRFALHATGAQIGWRDALTGQLVGQLAKYVPGKLMTLVGKVYLASRAGVPKSQATLAMFVEAAAQTSTALLVGLAYVAVVLPQERRLLPVAAVVVLAAVGALHPAVLPRAINLALRLMGRETADLTYRWGPLLGLLACQLALWCVMGLGLWVLAAGLGLPLPLVPLGAANALAWAAGFLSFIFPGGLGVREVVLAELLGPAASSGAAMSLALASRAWLLCAELLSAAGVWLFGIASQAGMARQGDAGDADPREEA